MAKPRVCKDCIQEGVVTKRYANYPGPRCFTHHQVKKKATRLAASERRVTKTYGLSPAQYNALYEAQGGRCYICRIARGVVRRLAVDHDHTVCSDHAPETGCPRCVRALLCKRCNYNLIGMYSPEQLARAIEVLTDPPAQKVLHP
jgi:hypothetical protein